MRAQKPAFGTDLANALSRLQKYANSQITL